VKILPHSGGGRRHARAPRLKADVNVYGTTSMHTGDAYEARVARMLGELGIPASYGVDRHMPLHAEAQRLVSVGLDIYGRDRQLTPEAAVRWAALRAAALQDGVTILLVSAFRSLEYQRQIFERKLAAGAPLTQILKVNAPPGYSEHHTGRAVDVTSPDCPPLSEEFEGTAAFRWLVQHASRFGFVLTYPRENEVGVAYEPWHWAFREAAG
jgi:D-alanyl-D-alanine carboxypeptidase